jgi:hypothetical protein
MLQDLRNFSFSNFPPAVDFLDNAMFIYHYCYIIRASFVLKKQRWCLDMEIEGL